MQAVWQHSKQSGGALVLLLAIADNAHDDGGGAYPSIDTLAKKARMTGRNVNILLKDLVGAGEIAIDPGAGPRGVNLYRVTLPDLATPEKFSPEIISPEKVTGEKIDRGGEILGSQGGEISGKGGVKPVSPKPSVKNHQEQEPSGEPSDPDVQFARFWPIYPKRKKRQECLGWFRKHQPSAALVDTMIGSVQRSLISAEWQKEGGRYIPLPDTWLNGKRWEDEDEVSLPVLTGPPRLELVGKDRDRMDVAERALQRRGYGRT